MKKINFESAKEMVCWLMDNHGTILHDYYGRRWLYSDFTFKYSDLGEKIFTEFTIDCLHLYNEGFKFTKKNNPCKTTTTLI